MTFLVGLVIGLVLGLTGAGGSLFAVPLLTLLLGMPLQQATGVALGAVAASAAFGILHRSRKDIAWMPALIIMVGGMLTAPLGRWLAGYINESMLLILFSILVIWVAAKMWRQASFNPESASVVRASAGSKEQGGVEPYCKKIDDRWQLRAPCVVVATIGGLVSGALSGLLGVGGGFVIVPLLSMVAGLTMQQAVSSSLLVISLVSSSGFASYCWFSGGVDWLLLAQVGAGGVFGMMLGSRFSVRLAGATLQQGFAVMLVLTMVAMWSLSF